MTASENGLYSPITKSIDIDESLALIALANENVQVDAWQEEALFRLPQASRSRRQEIVRDVKRKFLQVENDRFVITPLQQLLTWPALGDRLKRDLLFAQYLRTTPLVWEAIQEIVLPRAEAANRSIKESDQGKIEQEEWMEFLVGRLNTATKSTLAKTRRMITGHLIKFGLLRDEHIPGQQMKKYLFARYYEPHPQAFLFSLALEFAEQGWLSRSLTFIVNASWTRIAYCTKSTYVQFAIEEAERAALVTTEYFGSEKQIALRGTEPVAHITEAILYG